MKKIVVLSFLCTAIMLSSMHFDRSQRANIHTENALLRAALEQLNVAAKTYMTSSSETSKQLHVAAHDNLGIWYLPVGCNGELSQITRKVIQRLGENEALQLADSYAKIYEDKREGKIDIGRSRRFGTDYRLVANDKFIDDEKIKLIFYLITPQGLGAEKNVAQFNIRLENIRRNYQEKKIPIIFCIIPDVLKEELRPSQLISDLFLWIGLLTQFNSIFKSTQEYQFSMEKKQEQKVYRSSRIKNGILVVCMMAFLGFLYYRYQF